jgi:hypothetical protein
MNAAEGMTVELSLFTTWQDGAGNTRREFQPYLRIGGFEVCIDRFGICIHLPSRSFGYIRSSGFWARRDAAK